MSHGCLPGGSQHPLNLQWRGGEIRLPEDGVSAHRDADGGLLAGRGQRHKSAGLTCGESRPCYPTSICCQKRSRLSTTPTQWDWTVRVQTLYGEYLLISFIILLRHCTFQIIFMTNFRLFIAPNSASRRDLTVFTFINLLPNGLLRRFKGHLNLSSERHGGISMSYIESEMWWQRVGLGASEAVLLLFWMISVNGTETS